MIAERELEIKVSHNIVNANEKVDVGYVSTRQLELYLKGRQKIINERLDEKQHSNAIDLSSKLRGGNQANVTMIKLYKMSQKHQEEGKIHQQVITCGEDSMNFDVHQSHSSFNEMVPNATMVKLYALSEMACEHGKQQRENIVKGRLDFPVIKV